MIQDESNGMGHPATGREKILVVDDDETIVFLEKIMLEKLGYRVTVYSNSKEALRFLEGNPDSCDMLITDQAMPDMTGEELIRKVIALRPDMPIILNSGYSAEFTKEKAIALGVAEYINKPLNMRQLAQAVRCAFDRARVG